VAIEEVFLKAGWAAVIEEICKSVREKTFGGTELEDGVK